MPRGSHDLGGGYVLLRARDEYPQKLGLAEAAAVREYMEREVGNVDINWVPCLRRWARLWLPNGQIARSAWKEKNKASKHVRMSRNIKVRWQYIYSLPLLKSFYIVLIPRQHPIWQGALLFQNCDTTTGTCLRTYHTLFPFWSPSHRLSSGALVVCTHQPEAMIVVDIQAIQSVIVMVPFRRNPNQENVFFVV
jgi:hypothetical protein